ncbi:hypothetical protein C2S51_030257 [Perilla frutescens var. frutescens]|nr:hypothetical protein C2S51_030257 [Perilla frutescens var. frutescens]
MTAGGEELDPQVDDYNKGHGLKGLEAELVRRNRKKVGFLEFFDFGFLPQEFRACLRGLKLFIKVNCDDDKCMNVTTLADESTCNGATNGLSHPGTPPPKPASEFASHFCSKLDNERATRCFGEELSLLNRSDHKRIRDDADRPELMSDPIGVPEGPVTRSRAKSASQDASTRSRQRARASARPKARVDRNDTGGVSLWAELRVSNLHRVTWFFVVVKLGSGSSIQSAVAPFKSPCHLSVSIDNLQQTRIYVSNPSLHPSDRDSSSCSTKKSFEPVTSCACVRLKEMHVHMGPGNSFKAIITSYSAIPVYSSPSQYISILVTT